jgi:hypothetical protein
MLIKPSAIRERIHLYGPHGCGKSVCVFSIAQLMSLNQFPNQSTPAKIYILDNDGQSAERTKVGMFSTCANIDIREIFEWEDLIRELTSIRAVCKPDDWICVDLLCRTWDWVQDYYTRKVFGQNQEDFFIDARKRIEAASKSVAPGAFEGFRDWPYIKQLYKGFLDDLLFKAKCNVICCSTCSPVDSKLDDKISLDLYSRVGFKPAGKKKIGHDFHSEAYITRFNDSTTVNFVKDRARKLLIKPIQHFGIEYICGTCGWEVR